MRSSYTKRRSRRMGSARFERCVDDEETRAMAKFLVGNVRLIDWYRRSFVCITRAQDEAVEYEVDASDNKPKAVNVTGPAGANVLGAVRRRRRGKSASKADGEDAPEN